MLSKVKLVVVALALWIVLALLFAGLWWLLTAPIPHYALVRPLISLLIL